MHIGKKIKLIGVIIGSIAIVALFGVVVYQYMQLRDEVTKLRQSPQAAQELTKAENAKLIEQVRKLINVPADETPTIATVTDSEKLKNNAFFTNAMNGDKVLIYSSTKKAIIYRPGDNKIIEVGPVSIGTPSAASAAEQPIPFVLYNGTDVTGLTKKYEVTLKEVVKNATVIDRDNAKKRDYAKSSIIDLSGAHAGSIEALATRLGLVVGTLPEGETKPATGEYLIILGEDKK